MRSVLGLFKLAFFSPKPVHPNSFLEVHFGQVVVDVNDVSAASVEPLDRFAVYEAGL